MLLACRNEVGHQIRLVSSLSCLLVAIVIITSCARQDATESNNAPEDHSPSSQSAAPQPELANTQAPSKSLANAPDRPTINGVAITRITVGNRLGPDHSALAVPTLVKNAPIIVSIQFSGTGQHIQLSTKLTYQGGQDAGQKDILLDTVQAGQVTNVQYEKPDGWPQGHYTLNVRINNQPAGPAQLIEVL